MECIINLKKAYYSVRESFLMYMLQRVDVGMYFNGLFVYQFQRGLKARRSIVIASLHNCGRRI